MCFCVAYALPIWRGRAPACFPFRLFFAAAVSHPPGLHTVTLQHFAPPPSSLRLPAPWLFFEGRPAPPPPASSLIHATQKILEPSLQLPLNCFSAARLPRLRFWSRFSGCVFSTRRYPPDRRPGPAPRPAVVNPVHMHVARQYGHPFRPLPRAHNQSTVGFALCRLLFGSRQSYNNLLCHSRPHRCAAHVQALFKLYLSSGPTLIGHRGRISHPPTAWSVPGPFCQAH
jgi:hypothetical protein